MPLNHAPFPVKSRRAILLAEGDFSTFGAKTAVCYLRYRTDDVVAVIDRAAAGRTTGEVLGLGGAIPVVATVEEALAHRPELAIVGTAPRGGQLDDRFRALVLDCARAGLDLVSGLHTLLRRDAEVAALAAKSGSRIWDVRFVPTMTLISNAAGCTTGAKTVLTVGSDCNVGKMTTTIELYIEAKRRGLRAAWAATGQTGMMIRERGIAIDRVIADFVGGAAEELVNYEGRDRDIVFVEGQGSLIHPGYAGVTLGLLMGAMPDCQVLVHAAERQTVGESGVAVPPLSALIDRHEGATHPFKTAPVAAIAVNTAGFDSREASDIIEATARDAGRPAADPIRTGAGPLLDAVLTTLDS